MPIEKPLGKNTNADIIHLMLGDNHLNTAAINLNKAVEKSAQTQYLDDYLIEISSGDHVELKTLPALKKILEEDQRITKILLADHSLRPVFLQALPVDNTAVIRVVNTEFIEKMGCNKFFEKYKVFSPGSVETANELAESGHRLIVALTDRKSDDTLLPGYQVANGRQAYIYLDDKFTLLGIKGPGQFKDQSKQPYYIGGQLAVDGKTAAPIRDQGIIFESRAQWGIAFSSLINSYENERLAGINIRNLFGLTIGYQSLDILPDGEKGLHSPIEYHGHSYMREEKVIPVLIYNVGALYPHRLLKFPQILKSDPYMKNLRIKISNRLAAQDVLHNKGLISPEALMLEVARKFGLQEAVKTNLKQVKVSHHIQDFDPTGVEMDSEEGVSIQRYKEIMKRYLSSTMRMENRGLLNKHDMSVVALNVKIRILRDLFFSANEVDQEMSTQQLKSFFPFLHNNIKIMFQNYFKALNDEYLEVWNFPIEDPLQPIHTVVGDTNLAIFHVQSEGIDDVNEERSNEMSQCIHTWAQDEIKQRVA